MELALWSQVRQLFGILTHFNSFLHQSRLYDHKSGNVLLFLGECVPGIFRMSIMKTFRWLLSQKDWQYWHIFKHVNPFPLVDESCLKASTMSVFVYHFWTLLRTTSREICKQFQITWVSQKYCVGTSFETALL